MPKKSLAELFALAIILAGITGGQCQAQKASITFDKDYPQAGTKAGSIAVKGTIVLPIGMGATTGGTGRVIVVPTGGGLKQNASLTLSACGFR